MAIEVFNRHEGKFLIEKAIYEELQVELLKYMELDEYNKTHELYTVNNIYYDTKDNQLIRNSLDKPAYKEKLRIRAYGVPKAQDKVYLEIKKKVCGLVNKRRTKLRLNDACNFISSGIKPQLKSYMNKQVLNEIEYMLKFYDLEPKLYLAYDRKALFGRENRSLRITFDTNIRSRRYDLKLEAGDYGERLLVSNKWLMEVKTEKTLPLWLVRLLSEYKVYKTSFSKYGREYESQLINNRQLKGEIITCSKEYSTALAAQPQLAHQSL